MKALDKDLLEQLVDQYGLMGVLGGLETICQEKGEHLRANWQDRETARQWEGAAKNLHRVQLKINIPD